MGHSPGIDEDMMTSGPLNVDYEVMVETSRKLRSGLEGADQVHLTTPAGTDLWLDLEGRRFVDDLFLPRVREHFKAGTFPLELVPELGALGLLGAAVRGPGCPGLSHTVYGLICRELERGDTAHERHGRPDRLRTHHPRPGRTRAAHRRTA